MAAIDFTKVAIAAGVGVADIVAERWEKDRVDKRMKEEGLTDRAKAQSGAFKSAPDLGRLILCAAGYGAQVFMPKYAKLGETVAIAATPLLVKSIYQATQKDEDRLLYNRATSYAPALPAASPVSYPVNGPVRRSVATLPEFEGLQML